MTFLTYMTYVTSPIITLNATTFKKFSLYYIINGLCHPLFSIVTGRRPPHKTGFFASTCLSCGGADPRRKFGGLTVPVAAASPIVSLKSRPHSTKIGRGYTGNESKR
jgi:hypothetical protein